MVLLGDGDDHVRVGRDGSAGTGVAVLGEPGTSTRVGALGGGGRGNGSEGGDGGDEGGSELHLDEVGKGECEVR